MLQKPLSNGYRQWWTTCWWTWQVWSRYAGSTRHASLAADPATNWVQSCSACLRLCPRYTCPSISAAFAPHSLKLVEEWGFVLRTAGTYACHLRGQNLANAVSSLLHPEHGTLYRYISVRHQPTTVPVWAQNSSLQTRLHMTFTSENYWGVNLLTYLLDKKLEASPALSTSSLIRCCILPSVNQKYSIFSQGCRSGFLKT